MSWLSSTWSNPTRAAHQVLDPLGSAIEATHDSGKASAYNKGAADVNAANATNAPQSGGYLGDSSDPAYGSFAKPFDVSQFYNYADPGYSFQLQQGNQALQNSAAAGSGAMSGSAMKDLLKYNQDYAGTAYNDAFNRYQTQQGNIFNRLYSLTSLGQNAAAGVGNQGTTLAGNAGQMIANAGAAQGAGIAGAANNLNNGLTNYYLMNHFMNNGGGGGGNAGQQMMSGDPGMNQNIGLA